MAGRPMRISEAGHKLLKELSKRTHQPMQVVVDQALEEYRRKCFFDELDQSVLAAKSDPKSWKQELEERKLWEKTLSDGLDDDR